MVCSPFNSGAPAHRDWETVPVELRVGGPSERPLPRGPRETETPKQAPPSGDRFQRERLGTAFPKLFSQWERRSQEFNSSLIIRYTFCEHAQWRRQTTKSGSAFKVQLYFQVGQMEGPTVPSDSRERQIRHNNLQFAILYIICLNCLVL